MGKCWYIKRCQNKKSGCNPLCNEHFSFFAIGSLIIGFLTLLYIAWFTITEFPEKIAITKSFFYTKDTAFVAELWLEEGIPKYIANTRRMSIYEKPDLNSPYEDIQVDLDESINFDSFILKVVNPGILYVTKDLTLNCINYGAISKLTKQSYYSDGIKDSIFLKVGDKMEYLTYRAEGTCLFRYKHKVYESEIDLKDFDTYISLTSPPVIHQWVGITNNKYNKTMGWVKYNSNIIIEKNRIY